MSKNRKLNRRHRETTIHAWFLYDKTLTLAAAFVLAEIDALDGENGCFAMNKHFGRMLRVTADSAGDIISALVKRGRLERRILPSKWGRKRFLSVVWDIEGHTVNMPDGHTVNPPDGHTLNKPLPCPENKGSDPLNKRDAILDELNSEGNSEREDIPLPDFLNFKTKKGSIYLAAKRQYLITSPGFDLWFEDAVLKRFPKFTSATLNDTI